MGAFAPFKNMHGYTVAFVRANKKAANHKLGVRLGRACITAGVSVADIAAEFDVSRTAVYAWFKGESEPNQKLAEAIEQYIKELA